VKKWLKWNKLILAGFVLMGGVGLLVIQLITWGRDYSNPPVVQEPNWDSPETRMLAQRACFDCHSNETDWPWYSKVAIMSEIVRQDVEDGREVLNFSEWGMAEQEGADMEEMVEVITNGQMPPPYYLILHPEARLTDAETAQLINGLITTTSSGVDNLESDY
jgi:hypothetical protein